MEVVKCGLESMKYFLGSDLLTLPQKSHSRKVGGGGAIRSNEQKKWFLYGI